MNSKRLTSIAFFVLLLSISGSLLLWQYSGYLVRNQAKEKFRHAIREIEIVLKDRLELYVSGLYGVQGLFAASESVERDEWQAYADTVNLEGRYPGIAALKFIARVGAGDEASFIEEMRSDPYLPLSIRRDFEIYPPGERGEYFVVKYIKPFAGNEELLGFDVGSDPVRLEALERARDTGKPVTTGDTMLLGRSESRAGFFIYLPVYRNGMPVNNALERREALMGFVDATFGAGELFRHVFGTHDISPALHLRIFDGKITEPNEILYESLPQYSPSPRHNYLTSVRHFNVPGRVWTLSLSAPESFGLDVVQRHLPLLIFSGGVIFNALLLGIFYWFFRNRKAEEKERIMERQFRQAQKMEGIGRLAGGIAHDFNNLLTVINGYSELRLRVMPQDDPLRPDFEEIQKAGQQAAHLTSQLLAFSRRRIVEPKVINLNELIVAMNKMLSRIIGEGVELITHTQPALGAVKADPGSIEQVVVNLVVNARDAIEGAGKIWIETKNITLDEAYARTHAGVRPGEYVMMAVSDTGCGMTDEVKEHVFEPFYTTKPEGKGTGLGLATCFGIVKQSGGSIEVYSEPGQGTTFKLYFPRVDEKAVPLVSSGRPKDLPRGHETILLVEDEKMVRNFASRVLREQGYSVLEAAGGHEALRLAEDSSESKIHLLLTDLVMPGMGGHELAEQLKRARPQTKVIFTSGYTDNVMIKKGILEDGVMFLQKPFSAQALTLKIREALDPDSRS